MAMQRYAFEEFMLHRVNNLNPLLPHYWSELLLTANQLLEPEQREHMQKLIFEVEKMVLETEMRPITVAGKIVWVEQVKGRLSLYDIEMAIESNPDYFAYFEKEDGTQVSKFDVERKLQEIKKFIYECVREKSKGFRFKRFMMG